MELYTGFRRALAFQLFKDMQLFHVCMVKFASLPSLPAHIFSHAIIWCCLLPQGGGGGGGVLEVYSFS